MLFPHIVSVHSAEDAEVCGVGDPSVENQHLLVDHCRQWQPAEDLLQQLQDPFAVQLRKHTKQEFIDILLLLLLFNMVFVPFEGGFHSFLMVQLSLF